MTTQYRCKNGRRRTLLRQRGAVNDGVSLNGIDYIEVAADQKTVEVHFIHPLASVADGSSAPSFTQGGRSAVGGRGQFAKGATAIAQLPFTPENILITGGVRNETLTVESLSGAGHVLRVRVDRIGDYETYTLRLVQPSSQRLAPSSIDPQLAAVDFSFWVDNISELDCQTPAPSVEKPPPPPAIDYLAKDYSSFRRLMLDRLAVTHPQWQERNPADLGIMLVELLAYSADHLSYYQDAVATEAYLGTARRRISVRRHARTLDYYLHDGCNARAWVVLEVDRPTFNGSAIAPNGDRAGHDHDDPNADTDADADGGLGCDDGITVLGPDRRWNRPGVQFLSRTSLPPGKIDLTKPEDYELALREGAQVYETLHDITLYSALNTLHFYTWGDEYCCLPKGTTCATVWVCAADRRSDQEPEPGNALNPLDDRLSDSILDSDDAFADWIVDEVLFGRSLTQEEQRQQDDLCHHLKPGRVLIIEEVKGPTTGIPRDADIHHRHAVRLTHVRTTTDPLFPQYGLVDIEWDIEDAVPFDVKISALDDQGKAIKDISVVHGNVVLVDAGRSRSCENLQRNPGWYGDRPHPRLQEYPLTQQGQVQDRHNQWVVFDPEKSASAAMTWPLRNVRPDIRLWERYEPVMAETGDGTGTGRQNGAGGPQWRVQIDLLNSDRFARDFVAETEEDGRTYLRFGDGTLGKRPQASVPLYATYRTGNGTPGNVGADTIVNVWLTAQNLPPGTTPSEVSFCRIYNPLPAHGGTEPESIEEAKLYAPQAFRGQMRAVTAQDYATIAQTYPGVQKAIATRRWTGSWHTIFLTVDRTEGRPLDEAFKQGLLTFLEDVRLAGHDLEIEAPRFVPLDIAMTVVVHPDYFQSAIKKVLLEVFSSRVLTDGTVGFFAPSQLTFGTPVYLSQLVARAMAVAGVESVNVTHFHRLGELPSQELENGVIRFAPLEIAQLDNVPSAPQNGRFAFNLEGGR